MYLYIHSVSSVLQAASGLIPSPSGASRLRTSLGALTRNMRDGTAPSTTGHPGLRHGMKGGPKVGALSLTNKYY